MFADTHKILKMKGNYFTVYDLRNSSSLSFTYLGNPDSRKVQKIVRI